MRWLKAFFLPGSLALLLAAALIVPLPVFLERPGQPTSLTEKVQLDLPDLEAVNGDYLLMSVRLPRGTVAGLVQALLEDDTTLVSPGRIVPPGVSDREYFEQQRHIFRSSGELAAAIGLHAAGLMEDPPQIVGDGALITRVIQGAPADGVLEPGDVVVAVNGRTVQTDQDLRGVVPQHGDVEPLDLRFLRDEGEHTAQVQPRRMDTGGGQQRVVIGVELVTYQPRVDLPVPVTIDGGRIGGPSAGLMVALTVFDLASPDLDLAAGRMIAGTGGLQLDGTVRPIGGIHQKILAAHRHGADVFIAPVEQFDDARRALPAGSSMQVIGATTFDEAAESLRSGTADAAAAWWGSRHG